MYLLPTTISILPKEKREEGKRKRKKYKKLNFV